MSDLLGCDLFSINDECYLKIDNCDDKFIIYPDPVHMIKLIRNHLAVAVADAMDYCREVLKMKEFENSHATSNFIRNISDIYDILIS